MAAFTINGNPFSEITFTIREQDATPEQTAFDFIAQGVVKVKMLKCSFCDKEHSPFYVFVMSGNEAQERHTWTVCYGEICKNAEEICRQWLETGGINESESLRSDAYRVAKRRYDDAHRRY